MRTESQRLASATFWWMVLLAKRVRASAREPIIASTSRAPADCAARTTRSKISRHCDSVSASAGIARSHFDVAKPRRARAMAGPHDLLRLALAAVGNAPQGPMLAAGNGFARIPKLGSDAAVGCVLQHADAFAVANLPGDFGAELEVVTFVVDRPALVGLHVDGMVDAAENFIERMLTRKQTDVSHSDERNPGPAVGPHGAVRPLLADRGGGFPRRHVAFELPGAD